MIIFPGSCFLLRGVLGWRFPSLSPAAPSSSAWGCFWTSLADWGWVEQLRSQEFTEILLSSRLGRSQSGKWSGAEQLWKRGTLCLNLWVHGSWIILFPFSRLLHVFCKNSGSREQRKSPKLPISSGIYPADSFPCGFGLILTKSIEPLCNTTCILAIAGKTSSYHPGQLTFEFIFHFPQLTFGLQAICVPL